MCSCAAGRVLGGFHPTAEDRLGIPWISIVIRQKGLFPSHYRYHWRAQISGTEDLDKLQFLDRPGTDLRQIRPGGWTENVKDSWVNELRGGGGAGPLRTTCTTMYAVVRPKKRPNWTNAHCHASQITQQLNCNAKLLMRKAA